MLNRLHEKPATVIVPNGEHADTTQLRWQQFAEALRVMSYYVPSVLTLPRVVHHAADGELTPFALAGISANRGLRTQLRFGLLLSVTCSEDVPRIAESEIAPATRGTYLADSRVREQMEACKAWPHASLPPGYGDPIRSDVPVFLLSGEWDPVSTAADGEDAAKYLSNAIHIIAPGVHVPAGRASLRWSGRSLPPRHRRRGQELRGHDEDAAIRGGQAHSLSGARRTAASESASRLGRSSGGNGQQCADDSADSASPKAAELGREKSVAGHLRAPRCLIVQAQPPGR